MLNDFVEYWTAAKLMVEGGNPYSPAELLMLQRSVGWEQLEPLIMWNPPWTLSFIFFLGLFDYATAQFLWFLTHAVITFAGAQVLVRLAVAPDNRDIVQIHRAGAQFLNGAPRRRRIVEDR